jgi:tripartite-type tricarboxylate transporter receptor subunit TctC
MKKVVSMLLALLLCAGVSFAANFPEKDITDIVVWGAGGGTDVCNRVVTAEMAKILGVNINVVNVTGGVSGSIGMNDAFSKPSDGYSLAGIFESNVTAGVMGGWDKRFTDAWDAMIVGGSPEVVSVTPGTPYKTLKDLIDAAAKDPGKIKASASGAGSIHHLNLLAMQDGTGAKFTYIPYDGSAPAQTAAMTGEVSLVITSIAEQQQLIKGQKLIPLAVLVPGGFELTGFGNIPSAFDAYPELTKFLPISQAIGMAMKQDVKPEIKKIVQDAFVKAMATDAVKKWAADSYYILSGKVGADAKAQFDKLESLFSWKLQELGNAKVSPDTLKIPKP